MAERIEWRLLYNNMDEFYVGTEEGCRVFLRANPEALLRLQRRTVTPWVSVAEIEPDSVDGEPDATTGAMS